MHTDKSDLEIARAAQPLPITEVAAKVGLSADNLDCYGQYKAKLSRQTCNHLLDSTNQRKRGKLVLVTAITPTKAGEGKTTVSVGLSQALNRLGVNAIASLRQPSLGPVFGMKGGATGGGYAQLLPPEEINLHFTGDMHAIASANNLLAAMVDNHIHHGNSLDIDARLLMHKRTVDMNDRSLREVVTGLGGRINGYPSETGFSITAACEVMAALCLAQSLDDLQTRLSRMVVAQTRKRVPVTAEQIGVPGAMVALLRDAILPNLVQTLEGTPALVHGGPFANIAHGCSSKISARIALKLAEVVVTEAGFGADLGFEKFCDIVAGADPELAPDCAVLVTTIRALKLHGGIAFEELSIPNPAAVRAGLPNLERHLQIVRHAAIPVVVSLNKFANDSDDEIAEVELYCRQRGARFAVADVWSAGGAGGEALGKEVMASLSTPATFHPFYQQSDSVLTKLEKLASTVYGATRIEFSSQARDQLIWLAKHGFDSLPVCVAKTQYSLSADPRLIGAPTDFEMTVDEFRLSAGAGFVVALMGEISTMPGLPKHPAALDTSVNSEGVIQGLF